MLHTEVSFPSVPPTRGRDSLCRAQHPARAASRGAAQLGLAGSLCQGCDKGLPTARGSLQTGCQEASAALHVFVMLVMKAKTSQWQKSQWWQQPGEQWWRNVDVERSTVLPAAGISPGSSSNSGAEGCGGGPELPPSLCTSSNGSCGFSLQTCSPWNPLFARLKGGTCTVAAGKGLSFCALEKAGASSISTQEHDGTTGALKGTWMSTRGDPSYICFV